MARFILKLSVNCTFTAPSLCCILLEEFVASRSRSQVSHFDPVKFIIQLYLRTDQESVQNDVIYSIQATEEDKSI